MRFDTLAEWLQWQETLHPNDIELGLRRVDAVWRRLRPAGLQCPAVTVGGTNGKGSSVATLEAILLSAGYRVGCYTSPHLLRYNERIRINGSEVTDAALCAAFERVDQARGETALTYFEFGTLAALDLFASSDIELAILEVGLGGRLDAVNIIDPQVALVTSIGDDHAAWLGDSLDAIAVEKAGIFRAGRPAVIGQQDGPPALLRAAVDKAAIPYVAGRDFVARRQENVWTWEGPGRVRHSLPYPALRAAHQVDNAAAVLMALDCLAARFPISQEAIRIGLQQTLLPGRLQVIPGEITLILDVAHNRPAAENLARDLEKVQRNSRTFAVFGCFSDKDAAAMAQALAAQIDRWFLASPGGPRGRSPAALAQLLTDAGIGTPKRHFDSIRDAFDSARNAALPGDALLVFGSFMLVAEVLQYLSAEADGAG